MRWPVVKRDPEAAFAAALGEMAAHRVAARRERRRGEIAASLFARTGSVTTEDVERELAADPEVNLQRLADELAQKAAAAAFHEQAQHEHAAGRVETLRDKVDRFERHLAAAREALAAAKAEASESAARAEAAQALADYAASNGDASNAPPPAQVAAQAGIASAGAVA